MAKTDGSGNRWTGRRRVLTIAVLAGVGVLALLGSLCSFIVQSGQYVVVTEFGKPVQVFTTPGLRFKPPYRTVSRFDARLYAYAPATTEFLTLEKTPVVAASTILWRIHDARRFFQTVFDRSGAESRLGDILFAELGAAVGRSPLTAFVSIDPQTYRADRILGEVAKRCHDIAVRDYGIEVLEVQLRSFDFPKQNRLPLYARMKSERGRLSMQYRSEGEEEGLKVRATADREKSRILSEALKLAQQHRGKGEGQAARIYSDALSKGPEFYQFIRSMDASRNLVPKGTTLVLPANSELFGLLTDSSHYDKRNATRKVSNRKRKEQP